MRDTWLRMDDEALIKTCRVERFRASGPGGQRRNKVETAIRLRHEPTGITVKAAESRYQAKNLHYAAGRLRLAIALEVREPFESVPDELAAQTSTDGKLRVNPSNPAFPVIVAAVLDAVADSRGSLAHAAKALGITTSQLARFLGTHPAMRRAVDSL